MYEEHEALLVISVESWGTDNYGTPCINVAMFMPALNFSV